MSSEDRHVPSVTMSESSDSQPAESSSTSSSSFQRVQTAVNKSVAKLTSKNKIFPHIKEHLQPLYRNDSKNVLEIFKSMMSQLETMVKEETDLLFDSSNLEQLLGELDSIKQENTNTSKTWRPSGIPEKDLEAHLQESSEKELENFEKIHAALLSKNKWLNDCVQRASSRTESAMKASGDSWQEWEKAASVVSKDTKEELIKITNSFTGVDFLEDKC